eukprot:1825195-Amphidinium_carterae.1
MLAHLLTCHARLSCLATGPSEWFVILWFRWGWMSAEVLGTASQLIRVIRQALLQAADRLTLEGAIRTLRHILSWTYAQPLTLPVAHPFEL